MLLRELFEDSVKHVTFCFGRMNPPTIGHEQVFKTMEQVGGDMKIFVSQSQDNKTNPLSYEDKIEFIRKIFPKYADNVVEDRNLNTIDKVAAYLNKQGYTHATFVGGDDRKNLYDQLVAYNGKTEGKKGPLPNAYKFETLDFKSAGSREDDNPGLAGISATKAREAAVAGDLNKFAATTGAGEFAEEMYHKVRQGMGISEGIEEGYGRYWCSTDKKWKQRKGPKQKRSS